MRQPDWRWRAASYFAAAGRLPTRPWTDAWIQAAHRVALGQAVVPATSRRDRAVAKAASIRRYGDDQLIAELEARVLAGMVNVEIAERFGWLPGVIEAYTRVYFDVRSRLQTPSYVLHFAAGQCFDLPEGAPLHALWRPYAYAGGPLALDALLDLQQIAPRPTTVPVLVDFFAQDANGTAIRKLALAARRLPSSAPPQVVLRESIRTLRELRAALAPVQESPPALELDSSFDVVVVAEPRCATSA